ncbi:kinase-like protein [Auricularia subglabra TFB-10046 SS5]|nr:kinase-like protein [Auricularia subglabra TFB-10046 SS5]
MAQAGNPFDNYEPLEVIGTGSFGTIRKVRRKADGQIFARKELNLAHMTDRDRKQIVAEVNILKDLDHEHIVRYHDHFVDRDKNILYIVMDLRGDLAAIIQRCRDEGKMLSEDAIWVYFLQIVLAVHECQGAHRSRALCAGHPGRLQVLHRDIKPRNVFLHADGVLKMGDFGLSKQLASASFTNTFVGTPHYMSPEVTRGQAYDSKSDIWSLGCVLHEMCALNPPFHKAKTHAELSRLICSGRVPPLPDGYSRSLARVIKAMLNVDPAMRPSAQQLLQHERLDLAWKRINMDKMVRQVKAMAAQLAQQEVDLSARECRLEAYVEDVRALLAQKEIELRAAAEARERELCEAVARRDEEVRVWVERTENDFRAAWDARELDMAAREEAVRKEQALLVALRLELEDALAKKESPPKTPTAASAAVPAADNVASPLPSSPVVPPDLASVITKLLSSALIATEDLRCQLVEARARQAKAESQLAQVHPPTSAPELSTPIADPSVLPNEAAAVERASRRPESRLRDQTPS